MTHERVPSCLESHLGRVVTRAWRRRPIETATVARVDAAPKTAAARAMSTVLAWVASSALARAAKALTRRSWKRAVRSMLDVYCESYAWDEGDDECVVVRDVVVRATALEAVVRPLGLRAGAGGCTFGKMRFCISLGLSMDMELFTKPWRIEVDHFRLNVGCDARPGEGEGTEGEADDRCDAGESMRPSKMEEWLPLHRALENLQLTLRNAQVCLHSGSLAGSLIFKLDTVRYATTNEEWSPMTTITTGADYAGGTLHKLLTFDGFEAYTDRATSPLDRSHVGCSGPWDIPFDDAEGELLPVPQLTHVKVLFNGLHGQMKIVKKLKNNLTGRIVTDFFGDVYIFRLSFASDGAPKVRVPNVAWRLEWSEDVGTYILDMDEALQFSMSHQIDSEILAEINAWLVELLQALSEVAPSLETQLTCERARRLQEQAFVGRLHNRLDEVKENFREKFLIWRSGARSAIEDLNQALSEEQRRREVLEKTLKEQQEVFSRMYEKLQEQLVGASPAEQVNAVSRMMRELRAAALDPNVSDSSTTTHRVPFEGGYKFGDVSRKALRWLSKSSE